ncbi:MAG: Fe-S-containing hydro-lyase [Oscillospiraceae bacterium]|nr:Fe-S-containing hydro-lyase [Oscillospiraceae bacterium]MCL2278952.1 Fe-S-containing hydro-lyase [Oscillospiraceae bacterium]
MTPIEITTPLTRSDALSLKCGESVLLTGEIYTARDAAHARLLETIQKGERLPLDLQNNIIYYVGPTPPMPGRVIGSAGPTTSGRMDSYAPKLISMGITAMIGKGIRSPEVVSAIKKHTAVYFGALGGAGALLAQCVESSEVVAYEDLGAEAIRRLKVTKMPLTVIIDSEGNNLYERGRALYLEQRRKTVGEE